MNYISGSTQSRRRIGNQKNSRCVALRLCLGTIACLAPLWEATAAEPASSISIQLEVASELTYSNTPLDPEIDFAHWIRLSGNSGVLDPNSIRIVNQATGKSVPFSRGEAFAYGDRGRLQWVIGSPHERRYEIRFRATAKRPPLLPQRHNPAVGVGDLLRYNISQPGPITLFQSMGLHDLNGDGKPDLVGNWNYYYRPGSPTGGVVYYPAVGKKGAMRFGDLQRVKYQTTEAPDELRDFESHYNASALADLNGDGRLDMVYMRLGSPTAEFYLASSDRLADGAPVYHPAGTVAINGKFPCRIVDLDGDQVLDLVVGSQYIRNTGEGWPFQAATAIPIDAGKDACFQDLDGDGRLDAVCLIAADDSDGFVLGWRRNTGADPPSFDESRPIRGIDRTDCTMVDSSTVGGQSRLLVRSRFQEIHIYQKTDQMPPRYVYLGRAESDSAVLALGDQAAPCLCDWDGDGDQDLLIGDGYGRPRIVINRGTRSEPRYAEPERILAAGKPIRLLRNNLLGPPNNWHNMGYPYPDFVDWDGDGLRDLVMPNETNRIYWYRNQGTLRQPQFAAREQIIVDGYPDSDKLRQLSQTRASDRESNNGVYPLEEEQPFFWRTGAAFADFNGDGTTDLVTLDGLKRQATLFVQYQSDGGQLRLKKERSLELADGRIVDDRIVERGAHWGESFRAIDWDDDGLLDLIYGVAGSHHGTLEGGSIYLLRNCGTRSKPVFEEPRTMRCFGEPIKITNHGPHPWPGDYDGDGKPDLVTYVEWSVYPYYSHAALMMSRRPEFQLELKTR